MAANEGALTPLVVGVTGHRDLVDSEIPELRRLVDALFADLRARFPNTPLELMTALAEGADRLATQAAMAAGVGVRAVLPMPASLYREDFGTEASRAEFDRLCSTADVIELPVDDVNAISAPGPERDLAYANAGMFISTHCHILLAIWDGVPSYKTGGTAQIVYFQHYDRLPEVAESVPRTSLFLTDDESDLVYHVTCSRAGGNRSTDAMAPMQASWFTTDPDNPRVTELPARYVQLFNRTDEYNTDTRHLDKDAPSSESDPPDTPARDAALMTQRSFDTADQLANHYQRRVDRTLAFVHTFALLAGLTFIVYSELVRFEPLILAFLVFILLGIVVVGVAQRKEWHRKYLDYRVLAEGLRVQYYWMIAGVRGKGHTKFAYDNFLRQRDMELGWIRNVMRVAGTRGDALPPPSDREGLEFVIDHWIGAPGQGGQLDYYTRKASSRERINRLINTVTQVSLYTGIAAAAVLVVAPAAIGTGYQEWLIVMMGTLPLFAGIADVYTQRKADREMVKQYRFMAKVFSNARRRLAEAGNDVERREVLFGLGDASLNEHAEWILVHRERQPEPAAGL